METRPRDLPFLPALGDERRERVLSFVVLGVSSALWVGLVVLAIVQS